MTVTAKRTTHCKHMHPLTGDNLHVSSSGRRSCKACRRRYKAAYRLKKGHAPVDPTHCRKGHPFDAENTLIRKSGQRRCRICKTAADKAYATTRDHTKENERRRKAGGLVDKYRDVGAMAERAKIAVWLRANATSGHTLAAAIEAGEHLK